MSILRSGSSLGVTGLKRESSKADCRAMVPTRVARGRSGIIRPMQPRRFPRFFKVTKTPRRSIAAGLNPLGRGTVCVEM